MDRQKKRAPKGRPTPSDVRTPLLDSIPPDPPVFDQKMIARKADDALHKRLGGLMRRRHVARLRVIDPSSTIYPLFRVAAKRRRRDSADGRMEDDDVTKLRISVEPVNENSLAHGEGWSHRRAWDSVWLHDECLEQQNGRRGDCDDA